MFKIRGRGLAGIASVLVLLVALVPGADSAMAGNGNANVHVSKSVTSAVLSPTVSVALAADRDSVIPGDKVTYTATVSNSGAKLVLKGVFTAEATPAADATVGAYFDDVSTATNAHCGAGGSNHGHDQWPALAGVAGHLPGFTPEDAPPITTGMVLVTTPVPADGVTYPSSGDKILGTVIGAGDTATWNYTATLSLSPSQVGFVTSEVTRIRNSFHVEVSPRGNGAQPATVNTGFCSQLFDSGVTPSGALSDAKVSVNLPSGAPAVFDTSTTPGLASIASGGSVSVTAPYVVPVPDARGASESSSAYLARLAGVDGKVLDASATLTGGSSGGPVSVASQPVAATEHVPVVAVTKSGPASVDAGKSASYQVGVSNTGSADASDVTATDALPAVSPTPVAGVPEVLAAGSSSSGTATYAVPDTQPVGDLTDTASVTWSDGNGNTYGPTTASFTSQVTHPITVAHVVLAPAAAGPDVTGTDQAFTVTVTNTDGSAASGVTVTLGVTGTNTATVSGMTGSDGTVVLSYSGANAGDDTVQASTPGPSGLLTSNTATVSWITPVTPVSTTAVHGQFFTGGPEAFSAQPGDVPAFEQDFPTVNFDPPHGTVPHSIGNVGTSTRPFADVTTDPLGNYSGSVIAQGNGYEAGVGPLFSFDAVFTGSYVVKAAGDVTFDMYSDDGFILGVSGGATRVSGVMLNPPASGKSVFNNYPIMGSFNTGSPPVAHAITVHFPHAGVYPYELDYDECCGGTLSMTMSANGIGLPSAGSLELRPSAPTTASVGALVNMQVSALSASGTPLAGLPVTLNVDGANTQTVTGTTDAQGNATLSYVGSNTGTDQVLVGASVSGMPAVSNTSVVNWVTNVPGLSSGPGTAPTVSGVSPGDGTIITAPTPIAATITPAAGQTIASWSLTATANRPGSPVIPVASGSGNPPTTLGTFDPTVLANGDYTVTISVSDTDGSTRTTTIGVIVHGRLKPGRFKETFTDLNLPVAGIPIAVQRTYDSFDHSTGDFGSGWTMSLSDYQIAASRTLGAGGWSQYTASCTLFCTTGFANPSRRTVTVTAPDGSQQIFDFTPTGGSNVFWGGTAAFTPRAGTGTTGTLAVDGSGSFSYDGDGNLYTDSSDSTIFNPSRFKLTLKNGTVLILDTTTGLVSETDPSGNTVTVDATGVHSSSGASISVHRDTAHDGRITSVTDTAGRSITYHYNTAGELSSVTDVNGNTTSYSYDPVSGLFTGAVDGDSKPIVTLTYGSDGRLASIAHGSQPATVVSTNVGDRTQTVTDPNGAKSTTTTFDDQGDPISVAVFDGTHTLTTTSTFDTAGRRTDVTDPSGHHQHWVYDESATSANGNLLAYTDGSGRTWKLTGYNTFGQPGQILDPDGGVYLTDTYQSGTPLLVSRQVAGQAASTYSYYPNGLVHVASDPGGRSVTYAYNAAGYKISQADSSGATTYYTPDRAGRDTKIVDAAGRAVVYSFNGTGDVTTVSDPASGDTWSYHYNTRDLLDQATDPSGAHTSYSFDDAGQVISRTDRNGQVTAYSYDADGNVTSESRPGGDVTSYSYTPLEQLAETDNGSGEDTFTYDLSGNLASQTSCAPQANHEPCAASTASSPQPTVTLSYTYHPDGQQASVSGPAGTVSYSDDSLGRLKQVTDPANQTFTLGYDAAQHLGTMSRPNGVDDSYSYNPSGDLTGITSTQGTSTVASTGYGVDPVTGRVTSRTDQADTTNYGYEADGILSSVTPPVGSSQSAEAFTSNNFGDRLTGPTPGDVSSYSAGDRLTSDGTNSYTYDNEGNLKTSTVIATSKTTSYTWNTDHQLTAVHLPDGSTVTYGYDPLGRRIVKTGPSGTTRYVWDHWNVAATYNGTNALVASTVTLPTAASGKSVGQPAPVIEETHGTTHTYPLHDALGSVTGITDQTGTLTSTITYTAYGTPTSTSAATDLSTFTGYQWDPDSGLYYANHRYYNPATGRFLSEDPVNSRFYQPPTGANPLNPTFPNQTTTAASQNPYLYAAGDPTNVTDPTGMDISGEAILLGGMFGALSGGLSGAAGAAETCHGDQSCIVQTVVANIGIGTLEGAAIAAVPAFGGKRLLGCLIGGLAGSLSGVVFDWRTGADISSWNEVGSAVTSFAIGCAYGAVGGSFEP